MKKIIWLNILVMHSLFLLSFLIKNKGLEHGLIIYFVPAISMALLNIFLTFLIKI